MDSIAQTKQCRKCNEVKPVTEFYKSSRVKSGRQARCKRCQAGNSETAGRYLRRWKLLEQGLQRCSVCKALKPLEAFSLNCQAKSGRQSRCILCSRSYWAEHRVKYVATGRAWVKANPEKRKVHSKEYYERSKLKDLEKLRVKWKTNLKRWKKNNPAKFKAMAQKIRAKRCGSVGGYTAEQLQQLRDFYGNKCLKCGRSDVPLTVDHIIPLSRGGPSNIFDVQLLCQPCNSSKGIKIIDYRPDRGAHFAPKQAALFA